MADLAIAVSGEYGVGLIPHVVDVVTKCASCLTPAGAAGVLCVGIPALLCGLCIWKYMEYRTRVDMERMRLNELQLQRDHQRKLLEEELTNKRLQYIEQLKDERESKIINNNMDLERKKMDLHDKRDNRKIDLEHERETLRITLENQREILAMKNQHEREMLHIQMMLTEISIKPIDVGPLRPTIKISNNVV